MFSHIGLKVKGFGKGREGMKGSERFIQGDD